MSEPIIIRDTLIAGVKTAVQVGVAAALAWLLGQGIDLGEHAIAIESAVFAIATGLVSILLNKLGDVFPVIHRVMSFNLTNASPEYVEPPVR